MSRLFSIVLLGMVLAGCQTKQIALDQANHGVGLMSKLQTELSEFRRIQADSLKKRTDAILAAKVAPQPQPPIWTLPRN